MKLFLKLFIVVFLANSCTTYHAATKKHIDLPNNMVKVYPQWEYRPPASAKWLMPITGLSAGAIYGYQTEFSFEGKTFKETENAAIWGGVGLLTGFVLNSMIFPDIEKRKNFNLSQTEKWVKSFSKETGQSYLVKDRNLDNTLVLIPEIRILQLRQSLKELEDDLRKTYPVTDFNALEEWKSKLKNEYSILPIEDINRAERMIEQNIVKLANNEILRKAKEVGRMPNNQTTLNRIGNFKRTYGNAFYAAEQSYQKEVEVSLRNKVLSVLEYLMSREKIKLSANSDIQSVNEFYTLFTNKFRLSMGEEVVQQLSEEIKKRKTDLVKDKFEILELELKTATSLDSLEQISDFYLENTIESDPTITALKAILKRRQKSLTEIELAKKEAERKAKEQYEDEKEQNSQIIARYKDMAQRIRSGTSSSLLKFDDLQEILISYSALVENGETYNVSDRNRFIDLVESFGYQRLDNGNIGLLEIFMGPGQMSIGIRCTFDKEKKPTIIVRLVIPEAIEDIKQLYKYELTANYRRLIDSSIKPNLGKVNGIFTIDGEFYFSINIVENEFGVNVSKYSNLKLRAFAERLSYNRLKVTSWSEKTDIMLKPGEKITFDASGRLELGGFSRECSPEGITGFREYKIDSRFNYGALLGKIGDGDWFFIGNQKEITVKEGGRLSLRVNDQKVKDNTGYFIVDYEKE